MAFVYILGRRIVYMAFLRPFFCAMLDGFGWLQIAPRGGSQTRPFGLLGGGGSTPLRLSLSLPGGGVRFHTTQLRRFNRVIWRNFRPNRLRTDRILHLACRPPAVTTLVTRGGATPPAPSAFLRGEVHPPYGLFCYYRGGWQMAWFGHHP